MVFCWCTEVSDTKVYTDTAGCLTALPDRDRETDVSLRGRHGAAAASTDL